MNKLPWKRLEPEDYAAIPEPIHNWLIDTGSLTTRFRELCDEFSVQVLEQIQRPALSHEVALLELDQDSSIIERQVQLFCNQSAVVYARSLIPVASLAERFSGLDNLGTRPLGEKIFADPELQRSHIEWAVLDSSHHYYSQAILGLEKPPAKIFGRRSLFFGAPKPILISEFFLPTIIEVEQNS